MSPTKKKLNTSDVVSELSESAFFQPPTNTQVNKPANREVDKQTKPQVEKYTTHLLPTTIKAVKRYALEHDMKDYEVVQIALDKFMETDLLNNKSPKTV